MKRRLYTSFAADFAMVLCLVFSFLFTSGMIVARVANAVSVDYTQESFVEGNFRYYHIKNSSGVAVSWVDNYVLNSDPQIGDLEEDTSDIAGTTSTGVLTVPAATTAGSLAVIAVAPTAFRYCGFSEVRLPSSILEIGQEAFYCCENLTKFVVPPSVTAIPDSCFMDCRSLEHLYYGVSTVATYNNYYSTGASSGYTTTNDTIRSIGDHAFTSCVSLSAFYTPNNLDEVGDAAFQNCILIQSIFFPRSSNRTSENEITVGKYAFSDCTAMTLFYFEETVSCIGDYAFARCDKLTLYYSGTADDTEKNADLDDYEDNWRKKHVATNKDDINDDYVPINPGVGELYEDERYPGLYFVVQTTPIMFDGLNINNGIADVKESNRQQIDNNGSGCARVLYFGLPSRDIPGYFVRETRTETNEETGEEETVYTGRGSLTIPNTVKDSTGVDRTVKIISDYAFRGITDLIGVKFNAGLVQICKYGFYGCTNLASLDFSSCTSLLEVSYKVFQDEAIPAGNQVLQTLSIPASLKYTSAQAFYGFRKVTTFDIPSTSQLEFIGQQCFAYLGAEIDSVGTCDLVLPKTIRDTQSNLFWPWRIYKNANEDEKHGIMREAFKGAKVLRSVTMTWNDASGATYDNNKDKQYRIGVGREAFADCTSLLRFVSSNALYSITQNTFAGCASLKELFLSTFCSAYRTWTYYPWGMKEGAGFGGSIFDSNTSPDVVIYVRESKPPVSNPPNPANHNKNPTGGGGLWNENKHIKNNYGEDFDQKTPGTYPTYYGVDYHATPGIVKYRTMDKYNGVYEEYDSSTSLETFHFQKDCVSYLYDSTNRTVTGSYCTTSRATIDLHDHTDFYKIGECAFSYANKSNVPGTAKIVLPTSITDIKAYAFYRDNDPARTIVKVTYSDGTEAAPTNGATSYCLLPTNTTRIERFAFYRNHFTYVKLNGNIAFLGTGAFDTGKGEASLIANFDLGATQTNFEVTNTELYYKGSGQETLIYSYDGAAKAPDAVLDLSGTSIKAIAPHALTSSQYPTVKLPTGLKVIYGGAFQNNTRIKKVDVPSDSGILYIGNHFKKPDGTTNWASMPFDINGPAASDMSDNNYYRFASSAGAFYNCTALTTLNLKNMASLTKIGPYAFGNCSNLDDVLGAEDNPSADTYSYYKCEVYDDEDGLKFTTLNEGLTKGVLDLTSLESLVSIGKKAFDGCSKIKYTHLPDNSSLYIGSDSDDSISTSNRSNGKTFSGIILAGEKAGFVYHDATQAQGRDDTAKARYPKDQLDSCKNTYSHLTTSYPLLDGKDSAKYWIQYDYDGDGKLDYLLFQSTTAANRWHATYDSGSAYFNGI